MKNIVIALALLAVSKSAFALTLKEKKSLAEWKSELTEDRSSHMKAVKEKCGYAIPVTLDEKLVTPFLEEDSNAAAYCDEVLGKIAYMCEDAESKAAITKKIKKLDCKNGKKGEGSFEIKGTTLVFTYGVGFANIGDKTKEFLESHL